MKARFVFAGLALVLATALVAAVSGSGALVSNAAATTGTRTFNYQFEQMHEPWLPHANDLTAPNKVTITYGENGCPEMQGFHYARLDFSPTREAPATWLVAPFPASGLDFVTVNWWSKAFKTASGVCANCQLMGYVGNKMPWMTSQFTPIWSGLGTQWSPYSYPSVRAINDPLTNDGIVYVGIAVNDPTGNFAAVNDSVGFDCTTVTVTPAK